MQPRGIEAVIDRRTLVGQYTESPAQEVNKLREIYRWWVPRGEVFQLDLRRAFHCYLTVSETVAFAGTHVATALAANQIARILDAAGGNTDGKWLGVYLLADGTVRTVTAEGDVVDTTDPGEVTCSDDTAADHRVVYIPAENGLLVISIEAPVGLGEKAYPIFEADTKSLFAMNQDRFLRLSSPILLPPDFAFVVKLKAAWQVAFDTGTTLGSVDVPHNTIRVPVIRYNERDFYVPGEPKPGDTLRKMAENRLMAAVR